MILLPVLLLTSLGTALLAPLLAAHVVLLRSPVKGSRVVDWLGFTLALELATTFALLALACALFGPAEWAPYQLAYVLVCAAPGLGFLLARDHARNLRGEPLAASRAGICCLGFALALALALASWVLGAPLPFGGLPIGGQPALAGNARLYAIVVGPAALAMTGEAWLLRTRRRRRSGKAGRVDRLENAATVALVTVVLGATLLLPRAGCNPRRVAAHERAALRAQAARVDEPRRKALADILTGRGGRPGALPCPFALPAWDSYRRYAQAATNWAVLADAGAAWASRHDIAVCSANVALDLRRWSSHLDGPHRLHVWHALDEAAWAGPWPEHDVWVGPDEVRRRVRARAGIADWEIDATLLIGGETTSFSVYGKSNLGSVEATLWLWSQSAQAFVCAGQGRVAASVIDGDFHDAQANTVRDALRMRVLALAAADLHAVEP